MPLTEHLPTHLRERLHPIASRPVPASGELVLYWMHHAVRGHENPALEAAIIAAAALGLPLLVYQGLAGRHPYNNDRHHRFILEGARDAHSELAERGVRAVMHLPADPSAPSPLPALAARAALLVTEDYSAPPLPAWTAALAARISAPVWALDCACIIPLRSQPRRFERAFEFRRHNAAAFAARVPRPWPTPGVTPAAYAGPLPFTPLTLVDADLDQLIAACAIDHGVPPVPDTRGGSRAGYARWAAFREAGLAHYHQRRNDAADPDGVSRLSAYLHHGQVSPLRIAREAAATGGAGAEKFLDELLIWRELAHNFAAFTRNPEDLAALPDWARATLAAHADDPRPRLIDADTLARGATGERLWDLAQRALLRHGALHNNLRMTWAKTIAEWTPDPAAALATLCALNHRYALDGSDPNSYGGLLWALGLYDRPFAPERPVTGVLRPRPLREHARRLDLDAFARLVERPAAGPARAIAVIGAGLAGLACARQLHDQGHRVALFDKARGPGGRLCTRRVGGGLPDGLDHGAQYFTARDPAFQRLVAAWVDRGVVAPWSAPIGSFDGVGFAPVAGDDARWVGVPGMSAIGADLAAGLDLRLNTQVAAPRPDGDGWLLRDAGGASLGRFDRVLIGAPAPQAAALLAAVPELATQAAAAGYAPCWTVLVAFDAPLPLPFAGVFVNAGPLRWIAHDGAKPGRAGHGWVLDAGPDWSRTHLEAAPEEVITALLAALEEILGTIPGAVLPAPCWSQAHRWLYSLAETPLPVACLWDGALGIGAAGDWCAWVPAGGARVEGAWASGIALAARVLAGEGAAG